MPQFIAQRVADVGLDEAAFQVRVAVVPQSHGLKKVLGEMWSQVQIELEPR